MTTWLIVNGEEMLLDLAEVVLEHWNIRVITFTSGEDALQWMDEVDAEGFTGALPDVALLDTGMLGYLRAWDVGPRIRRSPQLQYLPIILTTLARLTSAQEKELVQHSSADYFYPGNWMDAKTMRHVVDRVITDKILNG